MATMKMLVFVGTEGQYHDHAGQGRYIAGFLSETEGIEADFSQDYEVLAGGLSAYETVLFYTDVGETLDEPQVLNFPDHDVLRGKRVLVIDEVWDTGQTLATVRRRVLEAGGHASVAVLHYKPTHSTVDDEPDYSAAETDRWIVYPWDPTRRS